MVCAQTVTIFFNAVTLKLFHHRRRRSFCSASSGLSSTSRPSATEATATKRSPSGLILQGQTFFIALERAVAVAVAVPVPVAASIVLVAGLQPGLVIEKHIIHAMHLECVAVSHRAIQTRELLVLSA